MVASAGLEGNATAAVVASGGASTEMGASRGRRDVYLTGFGKFGDIVENPTTFVTQKLATHERVTLARVLEVSAQGCDEELAELYAKAEESGRPCVFLHLGLSAVARQFKLESTGYNAAEFGIPDERGWVARGETIAENEPEALATAVPLEQLLPLLQKENPAAILSTDPGRYICNYVYFRSLVWTTKQAAAGRPGHLALFLHVPKFSVIPFEDQVAFTEKLIELVSAL